MTRGTYREQLDKSLEIASEDMNYFYIVAFGKIEKFSFCHKYYCPCFIYIIFYLYNKERKTI